MMHHERAADHEREEALSPRKEERIRVLARQLIEHAPEIDDWVLDDENLPDTVSSMLRAMPRRSPWDDILGPFYTTGGMRAALGISRQAIGNRVKTGSLVRVRTAEGESLFPAFQLHEGVPIRGLKPVVQALRTGTDDEYAIAQWLATPHGDRPSPAERLADGDQEDVLRQARHTASVWAL